jgi:hypothetical protein
VTPTSTANAGTATATVVIDRRAWVLVMMCLVWNDPLGRQLAPRVINV